MRSLVTIQQVAETDDGQGGQNVVWSTFCTLWVHAALWKGIKRELGDQRTPVKEYRFTGQYVAGVTEGMRLLYNSEVFDITNVNDDGDRRTRLVISATAGVPT